MKGTNSYIDYLFKKGTCQQLLILKLIYKEPYGADIDLLTKEVGIDRRSVYKHIESLKEVCDNSNLNVDLYINSKYFYVFTGDLIDYYSIRSILIEKEDFYKLAIKFLTNDKVNLIQFCHENFIGEVSFKKEVYKANRLLSQLGIKISIRKGMLEVLGEERIIRYCLISFLWRIYRGIKWPFKELDEVKINTLIDTVLTSNKIISYGKKKHLLFYLAVFVLRSTSGNQISKEFLPEYTTQLVATIYNYNEVSNEILVSFGLPQSEIEFILLNFFIFP